MASFLKTQNRSALWSSLALFSLLASLQMLKAVKDAMAIEANIENLQFLITGAFLTVVVLTYICAKIFKKGFKAQLFLSVLLSLILIIILLNQENISLSAAIIFIVIGAFSLIMISQFWKSLMSFNDFESGINQYAFIAIVGSLGGILGPLISVLVINYLGIMACVLIAIALLIMSNVSLYEARKSKTQVYQSEPKPMLSKEMDKRAILWIASFIFIYALFSTFIYVRQLEIVADLTSSINERVVLFSLRDLSIGLFLVCFQYYRAKGKKGIQGGGISTFPIITFLVFLVISVLPSLFTVMAAVVIFKSYNYALVRPARELFYLKTPSLGYFKNSIDSILYRGGDLLAIWLIYMIKFLGFSEWTVFFIMMPVLLVWWSVSSKIQHQIKPIK